MRFSGTDLSSRKVTCLLLPAALTLTPLCNFRFYSVKAFMPDEFSAKLLGGADSWSHAKITEGAIMGLYPEFFTLQSADRRGRNTIGTINWANALVDYGDEFDFSAQHFTSENFNGAQRRLTSFKSRIISMMQGAPSNRTIWQAQQFLGRALHTITPVVIRPS